MEKTHKNISTAIKRGKGTKFKTKRESKSKIEGAVANAVKKRKVENPSKPNEVEATNDATASNVSLASDTSQSEYEDMSENEPVKKHLSKYGDAPWNSSMDSVATACSGVLSGSGEISKVVDSNRASKPTRNQSSSCCPSNAVQPELVKYNKASELIITKYGNNANEPEQTPQEETNLTTTQNNPTNNSNYQNSEMENVSSNTTGEVAYHPDTMTNPTQTYASTLSNTNNAKELTYARINLNNPDNMTNLTSTTKKVFLSSQDPNIKLSKMSPFRLGREITDTCGEVESIEHHRSGSLLITTKTVEQVSTLLRTKQLFGTPIQTQIAWSHHLCYGKIYAPSFAEETLEFLLEKLKPSGVVGIRKLFNDPKKKYVPLYVLTFIGNSPPEVINAEYLRLKVDTYYPSPMRCTKCCRWGHSSTNCHSSEYSCAFCGKKGHKQIDCKAEKPKCLNCKGEHSATHKGCPNYLRELKACHLTVDANLTFKEAREKIFSQENIRTTTQQATKNFNLNPIDFPQLNSNNRTTQHIGTQVLRQSITAENNNLEGASGCTAQGARPKRGTATYNLNSQTPTKSLNRQNSNKPTHNTNAHSPFSSPESSIITPAQRPKPYKTHHNLNPITPSAPPETYQSSTLPSPLGEPLSLFENISQTGAYNNCNSQPLIELKTFLTSLLPLFLKLILAQNVTDRIECFMELGSKLDAESTTSKLLSNINDMYSQNSLTN